MPYKSDKQRKFFNANKDALKRQGVDVDHWNKESKGLKLPERVTAKTSAMKTSNKKLAQNNRGINKNATGSDINDVYAAVQAAAASRLRQQALSNALTVGGVGLGVGAGARGLLGLAQLVRRNTATPKVSLPPAIPMPVEPVSEEESQVKTPRRYKQSAVAASIGDFFRGDQAQTVAGVPWAIPATIGAGTAGVAGGWSAMDYLLDRRRKGDLAAELAKAKQEFEEALQTNKDKQANTSELSAALDSLYAAYSEKKATVKTASPLADTAGQMTGLYGLWALGSGGLAGSLMYNWAKKRQRRSVIDKALKERRRRRFAAQPAALYAVPNVMPAKAESDSMQTAPPQDELLAE